MIFDGFLAILSISFLPQNKIRDKKKGHFKFFSYTGKYKKLNVLNFYLASFGRHIFKVKCKYGIK